MTGRLSGVVAVIALIGAVSLSASAVAQGTGEDRVPPAVRSAEPGWPADGAPGKGDGTRRGDSAAPSRVEPRSGPVGPPSLGDVNRGMSGYYRNRIGMTPPSARLGGGRR